MKRSLALPLAFLTTCTAILISCSSLDTQRSESARPATDAAFTNLPFKKVINPTFAQDVEGQWIRCKVRFSLMNLPAIMNQLPAQYREGYVGITVTDPDDLFASTPQIVIPKAKSDPVFGLKNGDLIELFAYLVGITYRGGQHGVLFRVDKIVKLTDN